MAESSRSDHIGRIGENFFHNLADKAKLLVGTISPDRIGKDRVIEFELADRDDNQPFDKRLPPLKCAIQIKSVKETTDRVSLSLSVAERLIGDPVATFVAILKVNENDDVTEMRILHLLDEPMAKILKRLRKEYANGIIDLNKCTVSFAIKDAQQVDLNQKALKKALQEAIGADIETYASIKAKQRRTVGYDQATRLSLNVTFDVNNLSELVDGMIGLRPLPLSNVRFFEERFKIKLEDKELFPSNLSNATLRISPFSEIEGTITLSSNKSDETAELNCEIFLPPISSVPVENYKIRAKTKFFNFIFESTVLNINQEGCSTLNDANNLSDWLNFLKALKIIQSGECEIIFTRKDYPTVSIPAHTTLNQNTDYLFDFIPLFERFSLIRKLSKSIDRPIFLMDMYEARREINIMHNYIATPENLSKFSFKTGEIPERNIPTIVYALLINTINIGVEKYVYGVRFEMSHHQEQDRINWQGDVGKFLSISSYEHENDIQQFNEEISRISGCTITIMPSTENVNGPDELTETHLAC